MTYTIKETKTKNAQSSTYSIAVTSDYDEAKKIYHDTIDQVVLDFHVGDQCFVTREEITKKQWKYFIGYTDDDEKSSEIIVSITDEEPKMEVLPLTWSEDPQTKIDGYYISSSEPYGCKIQYTEGNSNDEFNYDVYSTEAEAESALAFARITQLMHNDHRYGGLITQEEWLDTESVKYQIVRMWSGKLGIANAYSDYNYLSFHSEEQRDLFLKENKELIMKYLMIKEE